MDLKCHFRPHFLFTRRWSKGRCVEWKEHQWLWGALQSRPHWGQGCERGHSAWVLKMRELTWLTSRVPSSFQILWLLFFSVCCTSPKSIYFISPEAGKKKLGLLFTIYSNINSNELTKNCSSLLSRLICQDIYFFSFTHMASSLCISKNNYLLR